MTALRRVAAYDPQEDRVWERARLVRDRDALRRAGDLCHEQADELDALIRAMHAAEKELDEDAKERRRLKRAFGVVFADEG